MSGKLTRGADPSELIPTMELENASGDLCRINAAPVYEGDDGDKQALRAHAKAVKDHEKALAEWASRGYSPITAESMARRARVAAEKAAAEADRLARVADEASASEAIDNAIVKRGRKAKPAEG